MMLSDQGGEARLDAIRSGLEACGLLVYLHTAVRETWWANRDRFEPDELYDDATTLGFGSARNLSNRVRAQIPQDADLAAAGVHVTREHGSTVMHAAGIDLRLVKAPQKSSRHPRFEADFRWDNTEGRLTAASRNHAVYEPPRGPDGAVPLFTFPAEDDRGTADLCRDVFLVWGADLDSGLTAAWLGLPTTGALPFIAVTAVWWDAQPPSGASSTPATPGGDLPFGERPSPTPTITLKRRRKEENHP